MRHPLFLRTRLAASTTIAALVAGCSDDPTRPPDPDVRTGFDVSADVRGQLGAALMFAREHSVRGLELREGADRVAAAFEALAGRVDANDRIGAEREIVAARQAIERYRKLVARDGGTSAADLDALTLTLDHATALVEERASSPEAHQP